MNFASANPIPNRPASAELPPPEPSIHSSGKVAGLVAQGRAAYA